MSTVNVIPRAARDLTTTSFILNILSEAKDLPLKPRSFSGA
jgi:hypothetical protein